MMALAMGMFARGLALDAGSLPTHRCGESIRGILLLLSIVPDLSWARGGCRLCWVAEEMVASAADVEQDHSVHDTFALVLEEHRLAVAAAGAVEVVRPSQSWVLHEVVHDTGLFFRYGHEVVAVHERLARLLLVVTVSTGVEKHVVGAVDLWIEQVVAFGAKVERRHDGERPEPDDRGVRKGRVRAEDEPGPSRAGQGAELWEDRLRI